MIARTQPAGGKTAAQFLDEGRKFLASKDYESALSSYSEAVSLEPENYMNYFQVCVSMCALACGYLV